MRWPLALVVVVVVASAGCRQLLGIEGGEVASDGAVDVADGPPPDMAGSDGSSLGHDEDGDAVLDTTDNCPTIPNVTQAAQPADEIVGSACDPRLAGGDSIARFFSFELPQRPGGVQGGQTFSGDHATVSNGELSTADLFAATRASVIISNAPQLGANNTWVQLGVSLHTCRVGPCTGPGTRCLQATGDNNGTEVEVPADATFRLDLDQQGGSVACRVESMNGIGLVTVPASGILADRIRLRPNNVTVDVDSFIVYTAP